LRAAARSSGQAAFGGTVARTTSRAVAAEDDRQIAPGDYQAWDAMTEDSDALQEPALGTAGFGTKSERFPHYEHGGEERNTGFTSPGMIALLSHRRWPREVMQTALRMSKGPEHVQVETLQLQPQPQVNVQMQSSFADPRPRFVDNARSGQPGPGYYDAPVQLTLQYAAQARR
jgi:hypothetical protein